MNKSPVRGKEWAPARPRRSTPNASRHGIDSENAQANWRARHKRRWLYFQWHRSQEAWPFSCQHQIQFASGEGEGIDSIPLEATRSRADRSTYVNGPRLPPTRLSRYWPTHSGVRPRKARSHAAQGRRRWRRPGARAGDRWWQSSVVMGDDGGLTSSRNSSPIAWTEIGNACLRPSACVLSEGLGKRPDYERLILASFA